MEIYDDAFQQKKENKKVLKFLATNDEYSSAAAQ